MRIALDFDNTYTKDRELWDGFIRDAQQRGHRVICVTARRDTPENRDTVKLPHGVPVFFSALEAKKSYMKNKWQMLVDVWIDDQPEVVVHGF